MYRRSVSLRTVAAGGGTLPNNFVSFSRAPGLRQQPVETLPNGVDSIPETDVGAYVIPEVVTKQEEQVLLKYTNPLFRRLPFNDGHVDGLIHHYKEFYRPYDRVVNLEQDCFEDLNDTVGVDDGEESGGYGSVILNSEEQQIVKRVFERCHGIAADHMPHIPLTNRVHFLQIHGDGFIRAHVDEARNSSGIVAGLTLGTGRVMNLTQPDKFPGKSVDLLLAPRSFYILASRARYEWLHSVDWETDDQDHLERIRSSGASNHQFCGISAEDSQMTPATTSVSSSDSSSTSNEKGQDFVATGEPVVFEGQETGLVRGQRTALIFRGISPMELFVHRMAMKKKQNDNE